MIASDVLIVGGGPGGSTCARTLSAAGAAVRVLDRAVFPRDKLCTGWITPDVVRRTALDIEAYARDHVLQAFEAFLTAGLPEPGRPGLAHAIVPHDFGRQVSYGIRRSEFDTYLLRRSGARVEEGVAVTNIRRESGLWVVNDRWSAPMLVGAGGHFCPVARFLNKGRDDGVIVARDVEVAANEVVQGPVRPGRPELYFCGDLKGYGWLVVKGPVVSLGLGRQDPRGLDRHVSSFVDILKALGRIRHDFTPRWRGHAYLLARSSGRRTVDEGVVLVGDAAGLAAAGSGEGIRAAVESGHLAGLRIARCRGDYAQPLLGYADALAAELGHRGPNGRSAPESWASWIPEPVLRVLGHAALSSRWLSGRLLRQVFLEPGATMAELSPPRVSTAG